MSNYFLDKNLAFLKKIDPTLFEKIFPLKGSEFYAVTRAKSGSPALIHVDQEGNKKQIDSNYDPVGEASRYLANLKICESLNFIVFGLGLGYQVSEIVRQTSTQTKIHIFERDPELFALAIREADFSSIFEHPGVKLFVDVDPSELNELMEPERINFTLNEYCLVRVKPLVDRNIEYYGNLFEEIEKYYTESRINLNTQTIHSKLYYKNIFSNLNSLKISPGINTLKGRLPDIPAIICSAGPSLDKNIQLLKSARKGFFLIAVATALKPLLHNGIQPDVIISIDPDEQSIRSFDFVADTGDTWLVYNAAVPNIIPKAFPDKKMAFDLDVYLAEWFKRHSEEKGSLGKVGSVAHAAFNLAKYLACSPIILVGQDLSFHKQRLHCRNSFYHTESLNLISQFEPLHYLNRLKYLNYGRNLTGGVDLFGCQVSSTLAMDSYNNLFTNSLDIFQTVINATEGGVPIKGMKNLSLRETLYYYCKSSIREQCDSLMGALSFTKDSLKSLRDPTLDLIKSLEDISEKVHAIKVKHSGTLEPDSRKIFINDMKSLYSNILEYKETALLLQGYDFAGFADWYRSNNQILSKKELSKDSSLLDEEFERDLKFLDVLENSVECLRINFKKSLSPQEN
ncbi:MAG: motility associated factor glycosyltransferase family protein [Nitrospinae bacterium]|nr:motility associated factor glycosyltransferase family protein [Nitrospinota bacterium]MBL7019021.1 motility associated factor glycosyltransferase family protein [Nitrospinaceae bacterium]